MDKTSKMLLTDTFEVIGKWFLSADDSESNWIDGILRYSPQRIVLELFGMFHEKDPCGFCEAPSHPIVYGFSESGEKLTLFGCLSAQASVRTPGFDTASYTVNKFYVGTKFVDEESKIMQEAILTFTNIDAWLKYQILSYRYSSDHKKFECIIDFNSPYLNKKRYEILSESIELNEEISFKVKYPNDFFLNEKTEIIINRNYRMCSIDKQPLSANTLFENMQKLRRLLSLLIGNPMYFSYIDFNLPKDINESFDGEKHEVKNNCRLFFLQVGDIENCKHLSPNKPHSILIKRKDIANNIDEIINNWYKEQDKLSEIVNGFISDLYLPAYLENKFLSVARGLESYHRFYIKENTQESDATLVDDRSKLIKFIEAEISEENKDLFLSNAIHEYEMSFRKRLKYLLKMIPEEIKTSLLEIAKSRERDRFITTIVETRNYFTHRDSFDNYPNAATSHAELLKLTNKLSIILQYFCLTQIGVDRQVVKSKILDYYWRTV